MARGRICKAMRDQISALREQGKAISAIAAALSLSRNTVKKYLREECTSPPATESEWIKQANWEELSKRLAQGVTIQQLAKDFAPPGVSYWSFRRQLRKHSPKQVDKSISVRQEHEPAKAVQIDFAVGLSFVDQTTQEVVKTHLFCAVSPFSSKIYAEFVLDQKLHSFISAQERMWRFFGGVTPYVVIDNLKAGVVKAHRYDPIINPTYCDFGNHYGFAVLPARPYHPKDKAAVECAIGVLQRTFYQEAREQTFYGIGSLNATLWSFLERLDKTVMKDYGVSRAERFAVESPMLLPLPKEAYEIAEWKEAKVHPDCCVQLVKCLYSVPHHYVGQTVKVKYGSNLVVIFDADLNVIARHPRLYQPGKASIIDGHYPDHKLQLSRYELQQIRKRACDIGESTMSLVEILFSDSRPLRHLRRLQGLFRLLDKGAVSREAVEYAASQARTFRRYHLSYLESCARNFDQTKRPRFIAAPERAADEVYLHNPTDTGDKS